jgi:hypothetical protein
MTKKQALSAPSEAAIDCVNALLPAANAGDPAALAELRAVLGTTPRLWRELGDLGRQGEAALIRIAAGSNPVAKDAIIRKLDALRREVAGPDPSPLERLLADRVAVGWLRVLITRRWSEV